jgi:hypothetical protein
MCRACLKRPPFCTPGGSAPRPHFRPHKGHHVEKVTCCQQQCCGIPVDALEAYVTISIRMLQAVAEVLAALKVVALEARVLDLPAKQAIT